MSQSATLPKYLDVPPPGAPDLYEIVNGRVTEKRMGFFEVWLANALAERILLHFASTARTGRVFVEGVFLVDAERNTQRRPDVAVVSYDRWPRDQPVPRSAACHVVPDLVVEVISPHDLATEVRGKVDEYVRAGARQVWLIDPTNRSATVHLSPRQAHTLGPDDALDGGDVLPGFRLPLADLFDETGR